MAGVLVVIPARYGSTRFPGKPLAALNGKPMIQHVVEGAAQARGVDEVVVATDDERIVRAVAAFGGTSVMTNPACRSGTERAAEVARGREASVIINVQGDEPAIHPSALATLARAFTDSSVQLATLVRPLDSGERANPNVVKVVRDLNGRALYF